TSTPYSLLAADLAKFGESGALQYAGRGKVRAEVVRESAETLSVTLKIAPGWHVNAHEVANQDFIPTSVAIGTRTSSMPATVNYPEYKKVKLGFSNDVLSLFEGTVRIAVKLTERSLGAEVVQLEAQACSDEICLLPEVLTLNIPPVPAEG
ncbi:MAG: protein-disulfide reductase DsbD domain-containing protein, partial [Pseudomonadota bacterium]